MVVGKVQLDHVAQLGKGRLVQLADPTVGEVELLNVRDAGLGEGPLAQNLTRYEDPMYKD